MNIRKSFNPDARMAGHEWEKKVFGISGNQFAVPKYLEWQDAVRDVIDIQWYIHWDPFKPKTPVAMEIFDCVKSYLPPELADRLQFLCAIGSALDWYHGIDGFFMIDKFIVSIDLSLGQKDSIKADVILPKNRSYMHLWRTCKQISDILKIGLT